MIMTSIRYHSTFLRRLLVLLPFFLGINIQVAHSFVPNTRNWAVKPYLRVGPGNNIPTPYRCENCALYIFPWQNEQETEEEVETITGTTRQTNKKRVPTISKFSDKQYIQSMGDLDIDDKNEIEKVKNENETVVSLGVAALLALAGATTIGSFDLGETANTMQQFFQNPTGVLEDVVGAVESVGNLGFLYFGAVYTIAEILAIPAIPLTASAGYLFGVRDGTIVVLVSASVAAAASFLIGRTLLRNYVEKALEDYPKFKRIDRAIGKEGFKLMLLLRLSPIFPFALSNYLYGVTSVRFWPFFFGTMVGFTPGTIAYVYTGEIGKALTLESANSEPWYFYAGGLALLTVFLKVVADVATSIIDDLDDDDE